MTTTVHLPRNVEGRQLPALRQELFAHLRRDPNLIVDGSNVDTLSPAGQALLLHTAHTARRRGGKLHLQQPSPAMTAELRTTGLSYSLTQALSSPATTSAASNSSAIHHPAATSRSCKTSEPPP